MQSLRSSRLIARLVLIWFVLLVGSAMASTLMRPGHVPMVCSGDGGLKMVTSGDPDGDTPPTLRMDCPLCTSVALPPPPSPASQRLGLGPLPHALPPLTVAHLASVTAPPLPSRGPPATLP